MVVAQCHVEMGLVGLIFYILLNWGRGALISPNERVLMEEIRYMICVWYLVYIFNVPFHFH